MSEFEKYLANRLEDSEVRAGYEAKSREYAADDDLRDKLTKAMSDSTLAPYLAKQIMPVIREALAAAWDEGYMRGQNPWTHEDQEADPIPEHHFPPTRGPNANPWRQDQP